MNLNKISTIQLILILGLIILFIPPLLIKPSFIDFYNLGEKNEIGDTLDGITSPFINAIAAIIVFIAFKEQVKANNLIIEQQYSQHIQEQLYRLEDSFIDISKINKEIKNIINEANNALNNQFTESESQIIFTDESILNKAIYSIAIFQYTYDLIDKLKYNKKLMQKKITTLYKIMYKENYSNLYVTLKSVNDRSNSQPYITELLSEITKLQKRFQN